MRLLAVFCLILLFYLQAVNLLIHLLSHPLSGSTEEKPPSEDEWVGPRLVNQETQVGVDNMSVISSCQVY